MIQVCILLEVFQDFIRSSQRVAAGSVAESEVAATWKTPRNLPIKRWLLQAFNFGGMLNHRFQPFTNCTSLSLLCIPILV